ncbi:MAG TPA: prenyltransferase/squalene oxidase repeat-containing protein [candidate division Zixibacteria bacterium]|nr:prenyltransferase/squalene oxidase repeat-containing protein [candidate division Zixibacteria bacterium]
MRKKITFRITMATTIVAVISLFVIAGGVGAAAGITLRQEDDSDQATINSAISTAASWLASVHQNDDGGYTSFSMGSNIGPSDVAGTVDAMLALASGGADIEPPLTFLRDNLEQVSQYAAIDGSTAGKIIIALAAADEDPGDFMGHDFAIDLTNHLSPTGQYGVSGAFNQSLAILGLTAAGDPAPDNAIEWLIDQQAREGDLAGSWSDGFGTDGNADTTAMAIMAIANSEHPAASEAMAEAMDFLHRTQLPSGGWEYGLGFGENANSTALVLQSLGAIGEDVNSSENQWSKEGITPLSALLHWQGDSGAFQADFGDGPFDDFFSTIQSLPALASVRNMTEQIFAPALAAETNSEPEPVVAVEPTAQSDEQSQDLVDEIQTESESDKGASGTGSSLCPSALAMSFMAGIVVIVPARRRRKQSTF